MAVESRKSDEDRSKPDRDGNESGRQARSRVRGGPIRAGAARGRTSRGVMAGAEPFVPLSSPMATRAGERGAGSVGGESATGTGWSTGACCCCCCRRRGGGPRLVASEIGRRQNCGPSEPAGGRPYSLPQDLRPLQIPPFSFSLPFFKMSAQTEKTTQPAQVTDMENTEEARFIVPEFTVKQCVPAPSPSACRHRPDLTTRFFRLPFLRQAPAGDSVRPPLISRACRSFRRSLVVAARCGPCSNLPAGPGPMGRAKDVGRFGSRQARS